MIDIMKQGLGLRTPQQERFGNSQELKSFGGRYRTRTARPRRRRGSRTVLRQQIAQNPEPFQGQRLRKGSGFLILRYFFVQIVQAKDRHLINSGTGSSCKQRKTGSSHWGTPCCTYRYRLWLLAGCVRQGAPCFCFIAVGRTSNRITVTPYRFLPAPARTTR